MSDAGASAGTSAGTTAVNNNEGGSVADNNVTETNNSMQSTGAEQSGNSANSSSDTSAEKTSEQNALDNLYDISSETNEQLQIPEQYSFTDEATGQQFSADDTAEFSALCKDCGLNQEQATKLFNAYSADVRQQYQDYQKIFQEQISQNAKDAQKEWRNQIMQDSEIGGENFNTTRMNIAKVMQKYGSKELSQFLNDSGIGYNPEVVRFFARIGAGISDDTSFIRGSAPQVEDATDVAKRRYPNSPRLWN